MNQHAWLFFCGLSAAACSEPPEPEVATMTPTEMQAVLDRVATTLEHDHPEALTGLPQATRDALAQARTQLTAPKTPDEFFFIAGAVMATLGDAHTSFEVRTDRLADFGYIDLPFRWLKEGPVVTTDSGPLRKGDTIVRIGGRTPADLLAALRKVIPAESDSFLRGRAPDKLVRSDYLRHLGLLRDGSVVISIERDGGGRDFELPLLAAADVPKRPADGPFVRYEIDARRSLGVFHLDACTENATYETTLQAFMTEVAQKRVQKVAIDLRQNLGGDATVAFSFLRYINKSYQSFSVGLRSSADLLMQNPVFGSPDYQQALRAFGVDPSLPYYEIPAPGIKALLSAALPAVDPALMFSGKLYVLTGPRTFSSANLFTLLIKDNKLGLQVGEPIGNEANFHGQQLSFDVPGTPFTFSSASSRNVRPDPGLPNQASVPPDLEVPVTRSDILAGRDPVIEALSAL